MYSQSELRRRRSRHMWSYLESIVEDPHNHESWYAIFGELISHKICIVIAKYLCDTRGTTFHKEFLAFAKEWR